MALFYLLGSFFVLLLYLEWLVGTGLVRAAAFVPFAIRVGGRLRVSLAQQDGLAHGVAAATLAVALHGMADAFLSFTVTYVAMAVVAGLLVTSSAAGGSIHIAFMGRAQALTSAHGCRLLHRAPAAASRRAARSTTSSSSFRTGRSTPTSPLPPRVRMRRRRAVVPRLVWMQTLAPRRAAAQSAPTSRISPTAWCRSLSPVPTVVTIHDMSLRLYPRYHPPRRVLLNRPLVDLAARRADAIITVSESAKRDIVRLYELDPARACTWSTRRRRRRSADARPGDARAGAAAIWPRRADHPVRRHDRAAQEPADADRGVRRSGGAAGELPHQLVCVGPVRLAVARHRGRRSTRCDVGDAVRFTGYVPFEDLPALYSLAEMFVYPSMYEGFGLPVVEAMACGTPVDHRAACGADRGRRRRRRTGRRLDAERSGRRAWSRWPTAASGARTCRGAASRARRRSRGSAPPPRRSAIYRDTAAAGTSAPLADRIAPRPSGPSTIHERATCCSARPTSCGSIPKLWEAQQPYPPLGALYAAACVRARGYRVALFDAMLAESEPNGRRRSIAHRPRFAVIYEDSFNYLSKMCLLRMRQAALTMIDAARERGITGDRRRIRRDRSPGPVSRARRATSCRGEGEVTLVEVLDTLSGTDDQAARDAIEGLVHCERADGCCVEGRRRAPIIRELDALPLPAWDLVDVERYRAIWLRAPRLLLDEHRDDARLSVSLQLVREADLRPALHRAIAARTWSTRSHG